MPLIKSAIKKMHQDRARAKVNQEKRLALKKVLKNAKNELNTEKLALAYSALDRAAKNNLIHKNKASRYKAQLAKLVTVEAKPKATTAPKKKVAKTKAK